MMVSEFHANGSRGRTQRTMALDQSALLEVLDALKAAEVDDRIRQAAETIYQALIEAELASVIGALLHERTGTRTGHRNGHRPRVLASTPGIWSCGSPSCARGRSGHVAHQESPSRPAASGRTSTAHYAIQ